MTSAAPLFSSAEGPLHTAAVDSQPELFLQPLRQLRGVQRRLRLERLFESVDHLFGKLVGPLRARSLGDQAR